MRQQISRAIKLFHEGQYDAARTLCDEALRGDPHNADALHLAGAVAAKSDRYDDAISRFQQALALNENWPEAWCNLGAAQRALGDFDSSRMQFRRALECDARYARAYFYLSQIGSFTDDRLLGQIRAVLEQSPPPAAEDQCFLHFAAGKICDDLGRFEEAFFHYEVGNTARQAKFDPAGHARLIDRIIAAFDAPSLAGRAAGGDPSRRPIFVVGMPRSGTSLVEQILASHPQVYGAGELPDIPSIAKTLPKHAAGGEEYPECVASLEDRVFAGFARAYLKRLDQVSPAGCDRVVDKNPGNFIYLGAVHLMFPRAVIIHCVRNPMSTCLSCYFQNFANNHEYAFQQTQLGFFYAQYERLMAHWHQVLPNRVFDLSYEQLVSRPEATTRELVLQCGLAWDDGCLKPHENSRPVSTASAWEVRRPIYQSSLQRWRNYEPYLGPLRNALAQGAGVLKTEGS